jgi:translation initiation factor IF-2
MTDKTATKKKIYQVAKEINISHETLMEYLKKRGHSVRSIMTVMDDEMMQDILSHFKKDKESAEKHQRKIQTLKEVKKKPEQKAESEVTEKTKPKVVRKKKTEQVAKDVKPVETAIPEPVLVEESKKNVVEVKATEETLTIPAPTTPEIPIPETIKEEEVDIETKVTEGQEKVPPLEKISEVMPRLTPKMGLKIKGKIDLGTVGQSTTTTEEATTEEGVKSEEKKRKKKKKRVRTSESEVEEIDELLPKSKKKKKIKSQEVNQEEVKDAIRRTLAEMDDLSPTAARASFKKKRKERREEEEQRHLEQLEKEKSILKVTEFVSVNELAGMMHANVADVIKKCIELGLMVSINQRLEKDTITLVADEFGFQVTFIAEEEEEELAEETEDEENLQPRPPVVTIMGHVDHGKTSLLDFVRRSNVVAGEAGGITQHIGAYSVTVNENKVITFLDTPGHEAFTAMRARGAQVTDIVVLVVAADDSVMPQTVEAISHAQAAGVPIVIALNKCDKPEANPDRIRQQLSDHNVLVEEWGGKYQSVEISARSGKNVNLLLEKIILEADVLDLKANPSTKARGTVIEARVDKGKGIIATVLVQKGTLRVGDPFIAGVQSARVRAMFDERGNRVEAAKPSIPVQVIGFDGVPQAGDTFICVESEKEAREISLKRQQLKREQDFRMLRSMSLTSISEQIQTGQMKELKVIVKGDVDGSVEALADSLMKIQHAEVRVNVIHRAVGAITESDVLLAAASQAIIIGFHVRPILNARRAAEAQSVEIRLYNIIYDAINEVKKALEGLLSPEKSEEVVGTIEVREVFKVPKVGTVAGCYVQDGKVTRGNKVRVVRDGIVIFEGGIGSLKRFKDDVKEVEAGFECGLSVDNFNDIKVGDTIEAFTIVETQRKLS